ncbi:hypothetical protein ACHAWF_002802 [Thalassiosira exigua]
MIRVREQGAGHTSPQTQTTHLFTMSNSDEEYQRRMTRGLFAAADDGGSDDEHDEIAEQTWTCPSAASESIVYHLAFSAPGHGDSLWNSSACVAEHVLIPERRWKLLGRGSRWPPSKCVEFEAGAALPSLALIKKGARRVVLTDRFVNEQTFDALRLSVDKNAKRWGLSEEEVKERVGIEHHAWGEGVEELVQVYPSSEKADLLIASDCIYNPSFHRALLRSAAGAIDEERGVFVVGYSLHGNVPEYQILNFFEVAKVEFGFHVTSEFLQHYDGQEGIGSSDKKRGDVHVKVLAKEGSVHCQNNDER